MKQNKNQKFEEELNFLDYLLFITKNAYVNNIGYISNISLINNAIIVEKDFSTITTESVAGREMVTQILLNWVSEHSKWLEKLANKVLIDRLDYSELLQTYSKAALLTVEKVFNFICFESMGSPIFKNEEEKTLILYKIPRVLHHWSDHQYSVA